MGGGLKGNGQPHQQQHRASLVRPSVSAAVAGAAAASGSNSTLRRDRNSQQQQQSSAAHFSSSSSSLQLQRPLAPLAFEESESEDDANIMFNGGRVGMHRQQRPAISQQQEQQAGLPHMNNATTTTTTSSNTTNASFADCESSDPESWPLIFDSSSTLANHLEKVQFKIATNKNNHRRLTAKSEEFAARAKGVAAKISNLEAYLNRLSARSTIPPPPSPPPNTINSNIKKRSSINDSPMLTDTNYRRGQASDFSVDDGSPEKKQRISSLLRSSLVSDNSTIGNNSSTTTTTNTHSNVTIPKSTSPPLVIQNHSRPSFSTRAVDFSASSASSPSIPAVIKLKQQQNSSPLRRSLTSFSLAGASSSSSNANANAVIAKRTSVSSAAAAAAPTANITSPVKVKANSRTHLALSVKQPFYMTKYFNRKPRCIIAYPFPATASSASDTLITSSLDGCVQIMDLKGDRPLLQVFKPDAFGNNWTEDIAWVAPDVLALAGKHDEPEPYKQQQPYHHQQQQPRSLPTQLSIIYSCSKEKKSGTFTPFKSSVCNLPQRPHEKGIACLVGGEWTASSNDGVTVFTGGLDKRIVLWDISKEGMEYYHRLSASFSSSSLSAIRSTTNSRNSNYHGAGVLFEEHGVKASLLDSTHTSALQALSYSSDWQYLYSGGLDRRFLARDLLNDSIICNLRLDDQVLSILQVPKSPNLIVLSTISKTLQHNIFDKRTKSIVHSFGADEGNKNISKYVRPAIHGDGFCVAMGSSASNLVNFFDLRYTGKGVVQDVSLHDDRVLRCAFDPLRSSLMTISVDLRLGFLGFHCSDQMK